MASSSSKNPAHSHSASAPDISIIGGDVSIHPAGYTEDPSRPHEGEERNLIEQMSRFRSSPIDFLREVGLYVNGTGWRSYDKIIGQPVFYTGFSETMKERVMNNPMLRAKIADLAERRVKVEEEKGLLGEQGAKEKRMLEIENSLVEVSEKMTDDMICKMESKKFIRGAYYLVTQLLTRAYHQGRDTQRLKFSESFQFPRSGEPSFLIEGIPSISRD